MTSNLRASFKERQRKRLFESFSTTPPPAKRTCPEVLPEMPVPDAPLASMPPSNAVRSDQVLIVSSSAEKDVYLVLKMTYIGQTAGDDLIDKNAPISSPALGWDEITTLLKQVSCFITPEPSSTNMNDFFPLIYRIFVDMLGNLPITVAPCLPHDTPEYFLLCIQSMQQYTAVETTEVVRFAPS